MYEDDMSTLILYLNKLELNVAHLIIKLIAYLTFQWLTQGTYFLCIMQYCIKYIYNRVGRFWTFLSDNNTVQCTFMNILLYWMI